MAKETTLKAFNETLLNLIYPVGSIYMSVANVSPATFLGGSWEQIQDTFLLAAGSSYTAGSTGGSADSIIPYHNHTATGGKVGDKAAFNTGGMSANADHTHKIYHSGNWVGSGQTMVRIMGDSGQSDQKTLSANIAHTHQVPAHGHTFTQPTISYAGTSGNTVGANMPPYLTVYIWKRTA